MKTIAISLICLLTTVSLFAQILNITSNFNHTETFERNKSKNMVYLPDSVIRTGLFGGVDIIRFKKIFSHDYIGNEIESIEFIESDVYNGWDSLHKSTTTFSEFNKPTENIYYNFDENNQLWIKDQKRVYSYDSSFNITDLIISSWNVSTESWKPYNKIENLYNSNNLDIKYTWVWNSDIQDWKPYFRQEYFYNNNGLTTTINKSWNETNQEWRLSHKTDYFYDSNSKLHFVIYYQWNVNDQEWVFQYDLEYFYNTNGQVYKKIRGGNIGQKNDYSYYSHGNLKQEDISDWNSINENWDWHDKYVWYYTLREVASIVEDEINDVKVFPNPADNYIQFIAKENMQIRDLTIYDSQGAKIHTKRLYEDDYVNTSNLCPGVHFYKIRSNSSLHTGKFIINR